MLITLITPTGGRPEAWQLCQKYILNQTTVKSGTPIQWIVVNDCPDVPLPMLTETKLAKNIEMQIIIPQKLWRDGINTQRTNMDESLKFVKGDFVFVIEDDDCYLPNYIDTMLWLLQKWDFVGQGNSRYYNIQSRSYKEWRNYKHTSLCETAFKKSKLDCLDRAINSGQLFFDVQLWEIIKNERHSYLLFEHIGLICGMKGLPGKKGIGGGHVSNDPSFTPDPGFDKLREWIGVEYSKEYASMGVKRG